MLDLSALSQAVRSEGGVSRRFFLAYSSALAALPLLPRRTAAADRKVHFPADPFSLGVASGDPDSTSVVLWTRLAPKPSQPDGGLPPEAINVTWEIAEDDMMKKVIRSGTAIATPQLGHSVHVVANGLQPDRWYWYRFKAGDAVSPIGRTRTMPVPESTPEKLKFTFASCQNYEQGYYTAYEAMAQDNPDLVFFLGDYIYESPGNPKRKSPRTHGGPRDRKLKSLADYRDRHAQYRLDPLLHGMHAQCPWVVTWDDHEVENNYANDIPEEKAKQPADPVEFLIQRAAAYQAYYEFMPLRPGCLPQGPDLQLYRKVSFGRLAEFFVLDTRQYRTDQPNGDGLKPLNEAALSKSNTILGKAQRRWLDASLIASTSTWNVLAQQVMMAMVGFPLGNEPKFVMDQWPGYAAERMDLLRFIADRRVPNPVVLTGDIHTNWANELRVDDRKHDTPVIAAEFVCTSISSGGNSTAWVNELAQQTLPASNPCVRFVNGERGYVRCTVTPKTWRSDYIVCEDVQKPNGKISTRASFVLESGSPILKKA